ncbi:MAG: VanZ family protein [Chitinophagaceae bacterium]|nr:MAG: VanZ family protein [Chitinophagaceae bacterium]
MSKAGRAFEGRRLLHHLAAALFAPYMVILALLFVVKRPDHFWLRLSAFHWKTMGQTVNLLPGKTILYYLTLQENYRMGFAQLAGNLFGFVPFGFLLPLFFRPARRVGVLARLAIALSLLLELFQYATNLGAFDVDDVLLNASGAVCGFFVLLWVLRRGL